MLGCIQQLYFCVLLYKTFKFIKFKISEVDVLEFKNQLGDISTMKDNVPRDEGYDSVGEWYCLLIIAGAYTTQSIFLFTADFESHENLH